MGMGGRGEAPKVMCLFGSESGTAKRGCQKLSQKLKAQGIEVLTVAEANSAAGELANLKEKCDVLVIATSSYGEGDPPDNFARFLLALKKATDAGEKPLAGMQHAVLGYGASCYETYQNVPRLTDKMLGECGSRRMVARVELDEGMEDDTDGKISKFENDVAKALQSRPSADAAPVCDWKVPESKILEKSVADLSIDGYEGGGSSIVAVGVAVVAAIAGAGYAYSAGYFGE